MKTYLSIESFLNSGSLKLTGQFSRDVIGWKSNVDFVNSDWSVESVSIRQSSLGSVCQLSLCRKSVLLNNSFRATFTQTGIALYELLILPGPNHYL